MVDTVDGIQKLGWGYDFVTQICFFGLRYVAYHYDRNIDPNLHSKNTPKLPSNGNDVPGHSDIVPSTYRDFKNMGNLFFPVLLYPVYLGVTVVFNFPNLSACDFAVTVARCHHAAQQKMRRNKTPLQETIKWCRRIISNSPTAISCLKAALNADEDGQAGVMQLAGNATRLFYLSEEGKEGKNAFLEKRKPEFRKLLSSKL